MEALATYVRQALTPAKPTPEDTLRACLDQVDQLLTGEEAEPTALIALMQATLARWTAGRRDDGDEADQALAVAARVGAASDEEIFAFIDNNL